MTAQGAESRHQFRACGRWGERVTHSAVKDRREDAERELMGWLPPNGRADEGWIETRPVAAWERICEECDDKGSGTFFGGCPSCGRIEPKTP